MVIFRKAGTLFSENAKPSFQSPENNQIIVRGKLVQIADQILGRLLTTEMNHQIMNFFCLIPGNLFAVAFRPCPSSLAAEEQLPKHPAIFCLRNICSVQLPGKALYGLSQSD